MTLSAGTLAISQDANLGTANETLTFKSGMLRLVGAVTPHRAIVLNAGGGININGNAMTASGTLDGIGGLTKSGTRTLTLPAANGYSGGTVVTGAFSDANNFGSGLITLNGGVLTKSGDGTLVLTGTNN